MSNIFVKTKGVDSWKEFLENTEIQWQPGYSAKSLANAWESNEGFPKEIQEAFHVAHDEFIKNIEFLYGFPEYKVQIPGGAKASQNDLYVLAKSKEQLICIMVEGKANEDFGPLVNEWVLKANNGWDNSRLQYLIGLLGLQEKEVGEIRYQLLHRTASALIEAERVGTNKCMVIVHSFSQKQAHFEDYKRFLEMFSISPQVNKVCTPVHLNGKQVYFLWVVGDEKYTEH